MVLLSRCIYTSPQTAATSRYRLRRGDRIWSLFDYCSTIGTVYFSRGKHYLSPHWTAVPCCPLRGQVLVWFTWENLCSGRHFGRQTCFGGPDWVKMSSICLGVLRSFCGDSRSSIPSGWPFCQVVRGLFEVTYLKFFAGKRGKLWCWFVWLGSFVPRFFARLRFLKREEWLKIKNLSYCRFSTIHLII